MLRYKISTTFLAFTQTENLNYNHDGVFKQVLAVKTAASRPLPSSVGPDLRELAMLHQALAKHLQPSVKDGTGFLSRDSVPRPGPVLQPPILQLEPTVSVDFPVMQLPPTSNRLGARPPPGLPYPGEGGPEQEAFELATNARKLLKKLNSGLSHSDSEYSSYSGASSKSRQPASLQSQSGAATNYRSSAVSDSAAQPQGIIDWSDINRTQMMMPNSRHEVVDDNATSSVPPPPPPFQANDTDSDFAVAFTPNIKRNRLVRLQQRFSDRKNDVMCYFAHPRLVESDPRKCEPCKFGNKCFYSHDWEKFEQQFKNKPYRSWPDCIKDEESERRTWCYPETMALSCRNRSGCTNLLTRTCGYYHTEQEERIARKKKAAKQQEHIKRQQQEQQHRLWQRYGDQEEYRQGESVMIYDQG